MKWVGFYWFFFLTSSSSIPYWLLPLCVLPSFTPYWFLHPIVLNQSGCSRSRHQRSHTGHFRRLRVSLTVMFKSLTFHVLFTVGVAGSEPRALPYSWRLWTSLLCRTRRGRWSALSSSVPSTSWSAQKNKREKQKRGEAAMTFEALDT